MLRLGTISLNDIETMLRCSFYDSILYAEIDVKLKIHVNVMNKVINNSDIIKNEFR